jgi:hypothetical protein
MLKFNGIPRRSQVSKMRTHERAALAQMVNEGRAPETNSTQRVRKDNIMIYLIARFPKALE